jgi:translation initiation factor IF-1
MHKSEDDTKMNIKIRPEDVVRIKLTTLGQRAVVDSYEEDDERQNFTTGKIFLD